MKKLNLNRDEYGSITIQVRFLFKLNFYFLKFKIKLDKIIIKKELKNIK